MHHEPVWKNTNLAQTHGEILETVGWISPTMRSAIALCDDFLIVLAGGKPGIEAKIKNHLGIT